jgi:hypothetical protein
MPNFSAFMVRLHNEPQFRQQFAKTPAETLRQAGFDPTMFAIPSHIDADALGQRLNRIFSSQEKVTLDDPQAAAKLTPDELWQRFGVIGLNPAERGLIGSSVADAEAVAVAVVVYGVSIAVTNANVAVVVQGSASWMKSVQQLQLLRQLTQQPRSALQFSVAGPDGVAVHGLSADAVAAVLDRAK